MSQVKDIAIMYPKGCRQAIRTIVEEVGASVETAYAMILMTSMLMDLDPADERVLHIILQDCGVEV